MRRLLLFLVMYGAGAANSAAKQIVVKAGVLIDGRGRILRNQQIAIEGSRIASVGPASGTTTYDLSQFTVMPGWIDTHVHLDWHFDKTGKLAKPQNEKPEQTVLYDAENAWDTLVGGFTTVQSVG